MTETATMETVVIFHNGRAYTLEQAVAARDAFDLAIKNRLYSRAQAAERKAQDAAKAAKPRRPRLDSLKADTKVVIRFQGFGSHHYDEEAVFLGVSGSGDDRTARFRSAGEGAQGTYEWEAYRYQGAWVYGSSAQRLSLVAVLDEAVSA